MAPTPNPVPVAPTPSPVPVAPVPAPVAPQPVPQPIPVPVPVAPVPVPVAPVPQPVPAPVATCNTYDVTNDGCSGASGANQFTYTRCDGASITNTVPCGDSIGVCVQGNNITVGADLTEVQGGTCT